MTKRITLLPFVVLLLCGCPEKQRQETIEQVGGAPKRQLDDVRARVGAAGTRERQGNDRADEATKDQ